MPENGSVFLSVKDLRASYGPSEALHGMTFEVPEGKVVTLLGRNGAGKTTTLRSVIGLMKKRSGTVNVLGRETIRMTPEQIARLGVAFCPEERAVFASLSVEENLLLPPVLHPGGMSLDDVYHLFPRLHERRRSSGNRLSGGEQQMIAIARILRTGAKLLLLDEITEGLAPVIVQHIGDILVTLKARGFTILLVEQNFEFAMQHSDHLYVVEHGAIIGSFTAAQAAEETDRLQSLLSV